MEEVNSQLVFAFFLIFGHLLGDYALRTEWVATEKRKRFYIMFVHSALWTGCVSMAIAYCHELFFWQILFLLVVHFVTDELKCNGYLTDIQDQFVHYMQLLLILIF